MKINFWKIVDGFFRISSMTNSFTYPPICWSPQTYTNTLETPKKTKKKKADRNQNRGRRKGEVRRMRMQPQDARRTPVSDATESGEFPPSRIQQAVNRN
jgi:hypothetical protein